MQKLEKRLLVEMLHEHGVSIHYDRVLEVSAQLGCWKSEMLVPWKEVVAVVAVGLWSMLSIAAVVNNPFLMTAGQTTPSSMYLLAAASPSCAD
jgi:hypothetical protein